MYSITVTAEGDSQNPLKFIRYYDSKLSAMEAFVGMINEFSGDTHSTNYTSFDVGKDVHIDRFWFHLEELAETAPKYDNETISKDYKEFSLTRKHLKELPEMLESICR